MLHVPNINMVIVDVERYLQDSFPDTLREKYPSLPVLPYPTREEFFKFGSTFGDGRTIGYKSRIQTCRKLRFPVLPTLLGERILPSFGPNFGIIDHRLR